MGSLNDKVAIITGAASAKGFGFATARLFAEEGAKVVMTDIHAEAVEARAAELRDRGFAAVASGHDVTDETAWPAILDLALSEFGAVDILVNNAGIVQLAEIEDTSIELWNKHISTNLTSVFLGCQTVIRYLRAEKRKGSIINISSTSAISALPHLSAYVASKGGVRLLTKTVALDVAAEGIRVNSVYPGLMFTEMTERSLVEDPDLVTALEAGIPMKQLGAADDIALMNRFLASNESKYITGAEFIVDGGLTAK